MAQHYSGHGKDTFPAKIIKQCINLYIFIGLQKIAGRFIIIISFIYRLYGFAFKYFFNLLISCGECEVITSGK